MKILDDYIYYNNQKLDFYVPKSKNFKTIVHFHGGGIVEGDKNETAIINSVLEKNLGIISVNYSLYPNAKFPEYIVDAANAVKFALENVKKYGGDGDVFVSGQSAGAYILMMLCSNHHYLKDIGVNPLLVKGWFSDSGQMSDHFHYLEFEEHVNPWLQRISEHSPLYFIDEKFSSSPICLIAYTNDMHCRVEQNQLFYKSVKLYSETTKIELKIIEGAHCQSTSLKDDDGNMLFTSLLVNFINSCY